MLKRILFFTLLLVFSKIIIAVEIRGEKIEYAGKSLVFSIYSDPVSLNKENLFELQFDDKGKFISEVKISKPTFILCDFGIYRGMLFLEPEKNVEVLLPPLREKSFADQKNPFFKPVPFWFNTANENDLSTKISKFEIEYSRLTGKYFNQLYFRQSKEIYDSVLTILNQSFSEENTPEFETYKSLKIKSLEAEVFRLKTESIAEIFTTIDINSWNQPAFVELFEKSFNNKLSFEAKDIKGKEIRNAIAAGDIDFLINFFENKYKLKGNITSLVLIKLLHDGFYSGEFSKTAILSILNSQKLMYHAIPEIKRAAKKVMTKLTHLQQNTEAPIICLNDIEGKKYCSNKTKDKFKYLVFADTEMIVCKEHLKYLSSINKKFKKNLDIIIILRKTPLAAMKSFIAENEIQGVILIDDENKNIGTFKIKSFPQCFLLDETHNIVFAETKAPLDGFEQQFGSFLRKELFERQRNQSR